MATLLEAVAFSRQIPLNRAGIYVIEPLMPDPPPLKVGYSANLLQRLKKYVQVWPWGIRIHGLALVPHAQAAERLMKEALGSKVLYGKEWIQPAYRNAALNAWATAHQRYAGAGPHGQRLFLAKDIQAQTIPSSFELLPERRLREKTTPKTMELVTVPRAPRIQPPKGSLYEGGVRRSARIAAMQDKSQ